MHLGTNDGLYMQFAMVPTFTMAYLLRTGLHHHISHYSAGCHHCGDGGHL